MSDIASTIILDFLKKLGELYKQPETLLLLGGGALNLLGSPRATGDIDYVGSDISQNAFQKSISNLAKELALEIEPVPFDEFVPFGENAVERQIFVGRFGRIDVYIVDPYAIALSKLDRGFETDLEDVVFLIRREFITLPTLETHIEQAVMKAAEFDLNVSAIKSNLSDVQRQI